LVAALSCGDDEPTIVLDSGSIEDAAPPDAESADGGACPSSDGCAEPDAGDAGEHACSGGTGTFNGQTIEVDGEVRYYFLHVPSDYRCEQGSPLWIDFPWSWQGTVADESPAPVLGGAPGARGGRSGRLSP